MSIETQQELAGGFVKEVVARFGIDATTTVRRTEDDGIYISVEGENLGLLVGPKGATVEALQELTRTVVQRHTEEHTSRIVVDVGGYRERRAAALRQFVTRGGRRRARGPGRPKRSNRCLRRTARSFTTPSTISKVWRRRPRESSRGGTLSSARPRPQSAAEPALASEADETAILSEESADLG